MSTCTYLQLHELYICTCERQNTGILGAAIFPRKYGRSVIVERPYILGNFAAVTIFPGDGISCDTGLVDHLLLLRYTWHEYLATGIMVASYLSACFQRESNFTPIPAFFRGLKGKPLPKIVSSLYVSLLLDSQIQQTYMYSKRSSLYVQPHRK